MKLDTETKFINLSERVKAVDYHPTEPWVLTALYNGKVEIWNHETKSLVKAFDVGEVP
ncbi:hypothetical protein HDV05_006925, partial [Chytridiales sp. JEL 0842]